MNQETSGNLICRSSRRSVGWLLAVLMALGAAVRLYHLGTYSFWTDEFFHVFAARSLLETGSAQLPSGLPYLRAFPFTCLTALFFRFFGVNEVAARIPSVLAGVGVIPLVYMAARHWTNRRAAVLAAFLTAFSPLNILWSQQCRMYVCFQAVYLGLSLACFLLVSETDRQTTRTTILLRLAWVLGLGWTAAALHKLSFFIIPSLTFFVTAMLLLRIFRDGPARAMRSKYGMICAVLLLGGLVAVWRGIGINPESLSYAMKSPFHALQRGSAGIAFYRSLLQEAYPFGMYLFPLALLVLTIRRAAAGLFLAGCFLVPLLILSIVFSWKEPRYILFILPFFYIIVASGIEAVFSPLVGALRSLTRRKTVSLNPFPRMLLRGILLLCCGMALAYPTVFPWIRRAPGSFAEFGRYNFAPYAEFVRSLPADSILICTEPFLIEYYSGRIPDFFWLTIWHSGAFPSYRPRTGADGAPVDYCAGIRLLGGMEGLAALEDSGREIVLISNKYFLKPHPSTEGMLRHIKQCYDRQALSGALYEVYVKKATASGGTDALRADAAAGEYTGI